MLVTCTGAHAEAAPLARTETGARAVCCQPARGEQTVLVARTGRDLPCHSARERASVRLRRCAWPPREIQRANIYADARVLPGTRVPGQQGGGNAC